MKTEQQSASQRMQSNRHLKEWCDNIALEIKVRYVLGGRHKQETSRLLLQEGSSAEQAALVTQQVEELQELKRQNSETRTALEERHCHQDAELQQAMSQSRRSTAARWDGVPLRRA